MELQDRVAALDEIVDALDHLNQSPLDVLRRQMGYKAVAGEGSPIADVMVIGEAPGEMEARSGRPFVGSSGKLLDSLLNSIGLTRSQVFITNIVKDRPPENRDPAPAEISLYAPFLQRQIEIIQPKIIATLGRFAMAYIFSQFLKDHADRKISEVHGQVFAATAPYGKIRIIPLYHPAVALYNKDMRSSLEKDIQSIVQALSS